jgi:mannose-6-phosphate isomerase-like protein (cupin superfamily)
MIIRFEDMEEKELKAFQGGMGALNAKIYADGQNKILRGRLIPGASVGTHRHETSSEIIFIAQGQAKSICDGKEELLFAGDCHYCSKGSEHCLVNIGEEVDVVFYAVVPQQ